MTYRRRPDIAKPRQARRRRSNRWHTVERRNAFDWDSYVLSKVPMKVPDEQVDTNAGCDRCGSFDRVEGSKYCVECQAEVISEKV